MRSALLAIALLLAVSALSAQQFPPDPRVDSVFAEYDTPDAPGCAVGIYRNGTLTYARGYGLADLEHRVPITATTIFDIGSTSKQFAAAIIVLLAREGKLSLEDDVRRFIPELPTYQRPITIRHLLNHTSGLRDYIGILRLGGHRFDDVTTPDDALQAIIRQRALNFAPGAEHLYSNSGYFLLSVIVERITGRSLRDEARDRLFVPLAMTRTSYLGHYSDVIPERAIGYAEADSGWRSDMPRWLQLGDGAVFTSVSDLAHWVGNFETPRVGGAELRTTLETRGRLVNDSTLDYALGLIHGELDGVPVVAHGGSWGGYRAELLRVPSERYGVAVLCNREDADPSGLARAVATTRRGEAQPAEKRAVSMTVHSMTHHGTPTPPPLPPATVVGSYRVPNGTGILVIAAEGDSLKMLEPRAHPLRPDPAGGLLVVGPSATVRLVFEHAKTADAPAPTVSLFVNGKLDNRYERFTPVTLSAEVARPYVGRFRSDELATTMEFVWTGDTLQLRMRNNDPVSLRALGRDEFVGAGLLLRAIRDGAGQVTGFTLTQGRMRDVGFVRE